jgi:predicted dehydrogenase
VKKFHVGIIGYGRAAAAHIDAINATGQAKVSAVYSSRELDSKQVNNRHGGAIACYNDLGSLLADTDLDIVSVCTYPHDHIRFGLAVAQAGKHLIIEKPLALNLEDCRRIRDAAEKANVEVCVCFEYRFSNQFEVTRSVIDENLLGKIHYGEVDYYNGIGPWNNQYRWNTKKVSGGSSLLSAGCHAMDALLYCMDAEVMTVSSYATASVNPDFHKYEYATTSVTLLKFVDGRVGKVASVIDCIQPYYFHVHLVGSEGSLLDDKLHTKRIRGLDKTQWTRLSMKKLDISDIDDHPYQTQFTAFFNALTSGKPMPLTGLTQAMKTHTVIAAADLSAQENRPVKLSELRTSA